MDVKEAAGSKKAVAACGDADVATPSSPRAAAPEAVPGQRQLAPLAGDAAAAVDSASATATTSTVESGGGGEDEQVEKFYALLANIRAMRDMYRSSGAGASADSAGGGACGARKKRSRGTEPAWRPAFRMEDFEEPGMSASSHKKERRDDVVDGARQPGKETATATAEEDHGDDVERKSSGVVAPPPPSPSSSSPPRAGGRYGST